MIAVYGLFDPRDAALRYVGKSKCPEVRLSNHCCQEYLKKKSHKNHWIKSLLARGLRPDMKVLAWTSGDEDANRWERAYIKFFRQRGEPLTNLTDGGDGVSNPAPEVREKIRRALSGAMHPNFGKKFSEETRRKMSESRRGDRNPNFGKVGAASPLFGIKRSAEHCEKLRAAKLGDKNPMFGKTGAKHHNFGKKAPPEVCEKIRVAKRKQYAKQQF